MGGVHDFFLNVRVGCGKFYLTSFRAKHIKVVADYGTARVGGKNREGEGFGAEERGAVLLAPRTGYRINLRIEAASSDCHPLAGLCEVRSGRVDRPIVGERLLDDTVEFRGLQQLPPVRP
ncbi:hypothetical protein LMG28138_05965 [Pararobbsia alpina]|uniref:Uncharacterized protein n=1 Tax=Pararobbsia alpina TaxID=621374 RepID=A0A6S7BPI4_9BURK|nr:hypothetical protein LMG28138_05965 [Pararobbsia alpina]